MSAKYTQILRPVISLGYLDLGALRVSTVILLSNDLGSVLEASTMLHHV